MSQVDSRQAGLCMVMLSQILWRSRSVWMVFGHEWIQPGEVVQGWSWSGVRGCGWVEGPFEVWIPIKPLTEF